MNTINRSALVVKPAQPFLDWLHRVATVVNILDALQRSLDSMAGKPVGSDRVAIKPSKSRSQRK